MEKDLTTQQLLGSFLRIAHKELSDYTKDGLDILKVDPDFYAHLIAWNQTNGEIRDSKVACPVIAFRGIDNGEYHENAVAHLLLLDPRNLVKAIRFDKSFAGRVAGSKKLFNYGIEQYLRVREANPVWFDRTCLQHRESMKTLYALNHIKPGTRAQKILFERKYPRNSVFEVLRTLAAMDPLEAAGAILTHKIPFMIAIGAVGGVKKNTNLLLALIESMSAAELLTNTNMLTKLGVMEDSVLKNAYQTCLKKVQTDKRVSSLKAGRAAEVVVDKKVKEQLKKVQEDKIDTLKGMDGDWLVLGDRSGSMSYSIEKAKEVAAFLARTVKGKIHLVFFDTRPQSFEVTGKSLDEIKNLTRGVRPGGATSIGSGLQLVLDKGILVNGIVIVSDGGENSTPMFSTVYRQYQEKFQISPTTYLLHVPGDTDCFSQRIKGVVPFYSKLDVSKADFYSLPNLLKVLRASSFSLYDEIMETKLLKIQDALKVKGG